MNGYGPSFRAQRVAPGVAAQGNRRRMAAGDPRFRMLAALRTLPHVAAQANGVAGGDAVPSETGGGRPARAGNPFANMASNARLHANANAAFMRPTRPGQAGAPAGADTEAFDQSDPAQAAIHAARLASVSPVTGPVGPPVAAPGLPMALTSGAPPMPGAVPPQILAMIQAEQARRRQQLQALLGGGLGGGGLGGLLSLGGQ